MLCKTGVLDYLQGVVSQATTRLLLEEGYRVDGWSSWSLSFWSAEDYHVSLFNICCKSAARGTCCTADLRDKNDQLPEFIAQSGPLVTLQRCSKLAAIP